MSLIYILLPSAVVLIVAYLTYGRILTRLFRLDGQRPTPAVELRDDLDYAPLDTKTLLPQHFSAIAAAGPIVGPILAGVMFGWLPALIWILVGSIFIGGVHDMASLVASVRHKARSIAEVVRQYMSPRSYLLFLAFVWLALVYIIVAFTDITAAAFVGEQTLENGEKVSGPGIATSSILYLLLPIAMGLVMRFTKLPIGVTTLIFLPLVGAAIWVGQYVPFDLQRLLGTDEATAQKAWDVILLAYCLIAAVVPVWLLLQPRGYLGGYFLYAALLGGGLGLILSNETISYPAFIGWEAKNGQMLFPMLFITIACGACSGFHAMIASGTTSKQLRRETDARPIGYGSMLLEAMVAVISLACVMVLAQNASVLSSGAKPNAIYGLGIGKFLQSLGIPAALGVSFALMAFTTFVYDTLDVCTRLGRYIIQELTGWQGRGGKWLATILTAGVPLFFVMDKTLDANGKVVPAYMTFWSLFGASNQLLAALTLLGVTVWLWRTRRAAWVWLVTGVPTVFMYVMSMWALVSIIGASLRTDSFLSRVVSITCSYLPSGWSEWILSRLSLVPPETASYNAVLWVAVVLVGLALMMLVEAVLVFVRVQPPQGREPEPLGQPT